MKKVLIILIFLLYSMVFSQNQWVFYTTQNSGLPSNYVSSILIDSTNTKWITTNNGFVRLRGNTWTVYDTINSGIPSNICGNVKKDRRNNIWLTVSPVGIVKYNGLNWTIYNDENTGYTIHSCTSISIDSLGVKWVGYAGGLLRFNDTIWSRFHIGNSGIPSNSVLRIFSKGSIVWVGTTDAGVGRFDGQSWTTYNVYNSGLPSNWIYEINSDLYNNIWFATRFGGVAKFNYSQNQWLVYNTGNSGLPSNYALSIYIDNNNVKWMGTEGGMAIFNDTNWIVFPYSFIQSVRNFAKDRHGNMWICGGGGLCVYNPNGVVGISNKKEVIPENFIIMRNYPNPFNSQTKIEITLPEKNQIKLCIYDINGRLIDNIAEGNYNKGKHIFIFNGNNLASGIYFSVLKTNKITKVHKIVLHK